VPVEVVGRPSIGEGRTPPGNGAGDVDGAISEEDAEPGPNIERDIPTLRLRNAMFWGCVKLHSLQVIDKEFSTFGGVFSPTEARSIANSCQAFKDIVPQLHCRG